MRFWTDERKERVAAMLREGLAARVIAERMGDVSAHAVNGVIRDSPVLRELRNSLPEPALKWDQAARLKIAEMLRQGMSGGQIAKVMGTSRHALIALVHRDKNLSSIGFARKVKGTKGKRKKITAEERMAIRRERQREYMRLRRQAVAPKASAAPKPKLRVVSNNVSLMVQDWIEKNGGARRFQRGDTSDPLAITVWLRARGIECKGKSQSPGSQFIVTHGGRQRTMSWAALLDMVDRMRMAEGLQPFRAA